MVDNDPDCDDDVAEGHKRHHDLGEVRDSLDTAENDEAQYRYDERRRGKLGIAYAADRRMKRLSCANGQFNSIADTI